MSVEALQALLGDVRAVGGSVDEMDSLASGQAALFSADDDPVKCILSLLACDAEERKVKGGRDEDGSGCDGPACEGVLVVCGSGYLMGQVRESLGMREPR